MAELLSMAQTTLKGADSPSKVKNVSHPTHKHVAFYSEVVVWCYSAERSKCKIGKKSYVDILFVAALLLHFIHILLPERRSV